ncbi:MAG: Trk system potassium transporter TrkA [Holosporales bacterium]|nr:Trk system potassium transporter TrkA [Holosporales bacterium]
MNVVILGAGNIGYGVARSLALSGANISIIDSCTSALNRISERIDAKPVLGDATDFNVLKEAGLQEANAVIAVTSSDETNIVACQIAASMFGTGMKIARLNKWSYFNNGALLRNIALSVNFAVSPYFEVSKIVRRNMLIPGSLDAVSCVGNKMMVIGVVCKKNSAIANVPVKYITSIDELGCIAILYIRKNGEASGILPGQADVIEGNDIVYFACPRSNIQYAMNLFGYATIETNTVVMIGGGDMCEAIIDAASFSDIAIKVIEKDLKNAELLAAKFDNATVLHGDPLDPDALMTANIEEAGVVISITEDDKTNIISCLLAKNLGAKRVAAVLNEVSYSSILHSLGINAILNSRLAAISRILRYLRDGEIEDVLALEDDEIYVFAVDAKDGCYAIGMSTSEIESKNEVRVIAIVRAEETLTLPRKILINVNDRILLIARKNSLDKIITFFQNKPKYLR